MRVLTRERKIYLQNLVHNTDYTTSGELVKLLDIPLKRVITRMEHFTNITGFNNKQLITQVDAIKLIMALNTTMQCNCKYGLIKQYLIEILVDKKYYLGTSI